MIDEFGENMKQLGWKIRKSDPLKITIEIPSGISKDELTKQLREHQIECEYADPDFLVFMVTPENTKEDLERLLKTLGRNKFPYIKKEKKNLAKTTQVMSIREAMFTEPENILANLSSGRICRVPTVSCPPAIPIAVPGEVIEEEMINLFAYYGIESIDVVKK